MNVPAWAVEFHLAQRFISTNLLDVNADADGRGR